MTAITGRTRPRLLVRDAGRQYRQASAEDVLRQARLVLARRCRRGTQLQSPDAAADFLRLKMGALEYEMFTVVFVDAAHRLIEIKEMFRGTVSQTTVHAREIIKEALAVNAAAVILAHNHPSGKAEPSRADRLLTQSLVYALAMVDVRVLDHLVITSGRIDSFARRGFL